VIKKKKLYILLYSLKYIGGAEKNFINLAEILFKKNQKIILILGGKTNRNYDLNKFETFYLEKNPDMTKPISILQCVVKIRLLLSTFNKYEIVLVSFGPVYSFIASLVKISLSFQRGIYLIVCERNSVLRKKEGKFTKLTRWLYFQNSNIITTNSKSNFEIISRRGYNNVTLVRNYFDMTDLNPELLTPDVLKCLIVSRLEPQKRVLETIDHISQLKTKQSILVEIFGQVSLEQRLRKKLIDLNSTGKKNIVFKFHGFISTENIPFEQFNMLISLSSYEGASNSMIEALVSGVPILCFNHHLQEVDFLSQEENCLTCRFETFEADLLKFSDWCKTVKPADIREITISRLNQNPALHKVVTSLEN